jgi:hypothetical protein
MIRIDGTIEFESPKASIMPNTTRDDFLASPLFVISKPLNQNHLWSRYSFKPITAQGERFGGDICFCSGAIYSLDLCVIRPEFGTSWNDFSPEKEQMRHCFHKELLQRIFQREPDERVAHGPDHRDMDEAYVFPWGTVSACTDVRTGGCDIFIKYRSSQAA